VVRQGGLEPPTRCLEGSCSVLLSYWRVRRTIGARGFEPPTPCSQSRCATGLRHAPEPQVYSIAKNQVNFPARSGASRRRFAFSLPTILFFIIVDLLSTLKRFAGQNILVIGDVILDSYIWGKVSRISPEAPVPVVDVVSDSFHLGGAANVANNVVAMGGRASVLGVLGRDRAGERVRELLGGRGIDVIAVEDDRPTTMKTRVIAHSQQVVRFDQENREKLTGPALRALLGHVEAQVARYDAVIVSDYRKGVVSGELVKRVLKSAEGSTFVAVDPKVGHFHLYKGVSMITPNVSEASQGSGVEIVDEASLLRAGLKLRKTLGLQSVLITRGEDGMSLFQEETVTHIPALARHVYDVTGAGDTVIAAYVLARAAGASPGEAALLANHAAGIVVGEVGTALATPTQLRKSVRSARGQPDLRVEKLRT
jgi:rfaE bifunctional protein kinase chain/domain